MDDRVRYEIYDVTMREGVPPTSQRVGETLGISSSEVLDSFRRLADAHMIVLHDDGEILMAGPFSAVPTPFHVSLLPEGVGLSCYGNCVWDALGIPAMLHADAVIDTSCAHSSTPARLYITAGELTGDGFMHFLVPARLWWLHIVYT